MKLGVLAVFLLAVAVCPVWPDEVLVEIPMDQQINIGLGDAITEFTEFATEGEIGFCRKNLTGGGWYDGPVVNLVKAGYGPYVDMSGPGCEIHYTARYFQGGGNTNPYGDAPIFVTLRDVNGAERSLGVSYGPYPYPIYPEWIDVTDDMAPDSGDAHFDLSKVVQVKFHGTDWEGTGQDFIEIRGLVITEGAAYEDVLVEIPMDQQINIGLGDAITEFTEFATEGEIGFCRKNLTGGGWYGGPVVNFVKAGYGPYVDMSGPGCEIHYTARYFQGGGNTNPYGDAPIFVTLRDVNWAGRSLGISYGPQPYPTYPEWIDVTDDMTPDSGDAHFDLSKVIQVEFYGTDWEGRGQDFIEIRDLVVTVGPQYNPVTIGDVKAAGMYALLDTEGVVTAVFPLEELFYIQSEDQACGIQVRSPEMPKAGQRLLVRGMLFSDGSNELFLDASEWTADGTGAVEPVFMRASQLGGAAAGTQVGVEGGHGANNTGLLVKMWGTVLEKTVNCEQITLSDASGNGPALQVNLMGLSPGRRLNTSVGERILFTGISSLYIDNEDRVRPMLRCRGLEDYESYFTEDTAPPVIKVAVVNCDPHCPSYGNKRTHEHFNWNDPHQLAQDYIADMRHSSGGWCQYEIVSWYDAEYYPKYNDGFQYTPDGYVAAWTSQNLYEGSTDHALLMSDMDYEHNQPVSISGRVASGEIDEVWLFAPPSSYGGWEASMVGPHPFFVNGGMYTWPASLRNFVIMGFSFERGVDCMLEDFVHRAECTMSQVYGPPDWWFPTYPATTNWDRFRMIELRGPGESAVGMCHYSPNSTTDYDWGNMTPVWSMCDDWLTNWPNLQGASTKRIVDATEWGSGDQRLHHIWWLERIPRAPGVNADGVQNNWWRYYLTHWLYPETD